MLGQVDGSGPATLVQKVVPLAKYVGSVEARTKRASLAAGGNRGVWVWSRRPGKFVGLERPDDKRPNVERVNRMLLEKRKGIRTGAQTARCMGVSPGRATSRRAHVTNLYQYLPPDHSNTCGRSI